MGIFETLTPQQQDLIRRHLELVIDANKITNLTRVDSLDEAMVLHVEDSLAALKELGECEEGEFADIGSGAGYPGIPLAVASGRRATLIDARQKKMVIVGQIIDSLGLGDQVETYAGRAELYARTQSKRYVALTARALSKLSVLMELSSPLLKMGGRLICYKAEIDESELAHARRVQKATGMRFVGAREFKLADTYDRSIVVFEKYAKPATPLPRLEGQAQKNPL